MTNDPSRTLSLDNIHTNLRLLPNDQWALDNFRAAFAGGNIELSGTVRNASAVRDWKFFQGQQPAPPGALQNRLRRLADALERTHFSAPPDLKLDIQGDARDPQSFLIRIRLTAPGSETPWGTFNNGLFTARLLPATKNGSVRAELNLEAAEAQTQWAATTNLHLAIHLASIEGQTNLVQGHLSLVAGVVQTTNWGKTMSITNADFTAQWIHALTNPIPISGQGHLLCEAADTRWGAAQKIELDTRLLDPATIPQAAVSAPHSNLPEWVTNLEPHALDWQCHLTNLRSPKLELDELALSGTWRFPQLTITIPQAQLYQGELAARVTLDVLSRSVTANVASDCDLHLASALLTDFGRRWLAQFSWTKPPEVAADLSFVLPDWESDAWRARSDEQLSSPANPHSSLPSSPVTRPRSPLVTHLLPSFQLEGQFRVDHGGAFNDVPASAARGHFSYSNMTWRLPDLAITRPEGRIDVFHQANDRTKDYYWKFHSTIDVTSIRPLLETNQQRALDYLTFTQPPVIDAEVWGRWHDHSRSGVKAEVALTNFTFRGQAANSFQTALQYTNRLLQLTKAHAWIGTQLLSATSLAVDYANQKIYLTNGFSTADPRIVTRAIGPKVDASIEPYVFSRPPTARVYGIIPIASESDADLHFDLDGGPFHWLRFNLEHVTGHIDWKGQHLALRNVRANLYGGYASGSAEFDFRAQHGTAYRFDLITTNAQLKWIMADLSTHTNNL